MALVVGNLSVILEARATRFKQTLEGASRALEGISQRMQGVGVRSALAGAAVGAFGFKLVKAASDAAETASFMRIAFGASTDAVQEWAARTGDAMNRSQYQMRQFAVTLQAMLSGMVGSEEAAAKMSMRMAELAVDIGSARNIADDLALEKLRAGLAGEMEPLRQLGVVMSVAELKAFALSRGIRTSYEAMTAAEKVTLRYNFILAKTTLDQGDAIRTSESFANRLKGLQGRMHDLAVEMGQRLMPVAESFLGRIEKIVDAFGGLDGATKNMVLQAGIIGGAVLALGVALIPLGAIGSVLATVAGALGVVAIPLVKILLVVTAAVAAVGALKVAWDTDFAGMRTAVEGVGDALDGILDKIDDVIEKGASLFEEAKRWAADTGRQIIAPGSKSDEDLLREGVGMGTDELGGNMTDAQLKAAGFGVDNGASADLSLGDRASQVGEVAAAKLAADGKLLGDTLAAAAAGIGGALKIGAGVIMEAIPPELRAKMDKAFADLEKMLAGLKGELDKVGTAGAEKATITLVGLAEAVDGAAEKTRTFGERMQETWGKLKAIVASLPGGVAGGLAVAGKAANTGVLSTVIGGATEGASAGGPWGAVAGAVVGLLTASESFGRLIEVVNRTLQFFADTLGTILEPFIPVIEVLFGAIRPLVAVLAPLLRILVMLNPVFAVLLVTSKLLAAVTRFLFDAIRAVGIGMLKAVKRVLKAVGASSRAVNNALNDLEEMSFDTAGNIEDLGDAARGAAEALLNVPEGVKVAAYRFRATSIFQPPGGGLPPIPPDGGGNDPNNPDAPPVGTMDPGPVGGEGTSSPSSSANAATSAGGDVTIIERVELYALNVEDAFEEFERMRRRKNYVSHGSPLGHGSPFMGGRKG